MEISAWGSYGGILLKLHQLRAFALAAAESKDTELVLEKFGIEIGATLPLLCTR